MKMKNLQIWNLCEYGISKTYVQDLYEKQLTLEDIESLDNTTFNTFLEKTRDKLYNDLQVLIPQIKWTFYNHTSIYCLYATNLSERLITMLIEKGLTIGQLKYASIHWLVEVKEIGKSNANKIIEAVAKVADDIVVVEEEFTFLMQDDLLLQSFKDKIYNFVALHKNVHEKDLKKMVEFEYYEKAATQILKSMFDVSLSFKAPIIAILKKADIEVSLYEFLYSIQDETKQTMLEKRLQGITLEEIGKEFLITRERVRQIVQGILNRRPKIHEDQFCDVFMKYEFTKEEFCSIFDQAEMVYYYLLHTYGKGHQPLKEMVEDTTLPVRIRKRAIRFAYENFFVLDDAYVAKRKQDLVEYIIQKHCKDNMKIIDIHGLYDAFIATHVKADERSRWEMDERHFDNCVANMKNCLQSYGKSARFYLLSQYDFTFFITRLDIMDYMNLCISTALLFKNYSDLMEEYDIRNEFELHNLLKKVQIQEIYPDIKMSRMPFIEIGQTNRDDMVYQALVHIAPCTIDDIAQYLYDNYGIQPDTAKANWLHGISMYLSEGLYRLDVAMLDTNDIAYFKKIFIHDFYLKSYVEKEFKKRLRDEYKKYINNVNFKAIGYHLNGQYMFKYSYSSMTNYVEHLLLSSNTFDLRDFSRELRFLPIFLDRLIALKKDFAIFEYEPKKYLNIRVLEALQVNKTMLLSFCNRIYNLEVDDYFSLRMIHPQIEDDAVLKLPYPRYLFDTIVRFSSLFAYTSINGVHIFSKKYKRIDVNKFFHYIMKEKRKISVNEMIQYLACKYGVELDKHKLFSFISNSSIYFDAKEDYIYYNYNEYIQYLKTN